MSSLNVSNFLVTRVNGTTFNLYDKTKPSTVIAAKQTVELLGADTIDISVKSAVRIDFGIGDKITMIGRDYTLNTPAKERKVSGTLFLYDLQFEGVQYDLLRASYNVNVDTTNGKVQDLSGDSLTGDIKMFLDVLIANANRVLGTGKWSIGTYPANTKTITLTFADSDNCLSVLQSLCGEDNYNTEFRIAIDGSGHRTINVGATGTVMGYTFEYGKDRGIYELTREKVSSSNIVTRLNCFGSAKNIITSKYRASKLCLPSKTKAQSYLEDATAIAQYGVWENTKNFEDIYPHREGTVSGLGASELEMIDSSMDFDLNAKEVDGVTTKYMIAGMSPKIHFNTGNLAGYEFELSSYNHTTKKFTLIAMTDENGYTFPSSTSSAFKFAAGDKYTITDIYMPQSYIDTAEAALQTAGQAYLNKYKQPLVQYGLKLDSLFLKNIVGANAESNIIWVGDYIPIYDIDIEVDKTIRVKGLSRDLLSTYAYDITIADLPITVSTITRVITELNGIDKVVRINNLNDPAKARRNWKDSQEVLNMVFDPEGDFYTDKIKPLSIDTSMLSVGAKSMQFGLAGTIFQPNYAGAKNRVVYTGGTLTHYAVLDVNGSPRNWYITDGDITLTTDAPHYVYAKCARVGTGASILFSTTKVLTESDATYYHFLIGIINSVDTNNVRAMALMYGFSTVNGRFIKTGRIQSADGNTYFDLDAGVLQGNLKFNSGASVETAVNDTAAIARAMQYGKMLYKDPMFATGNNGISAYNNSGGNNLTMTRIAAISDSPNTGYILKISLVSPFNLSPGLGGFYFATTARANAVLITRIVAKIPVGFTIQFASNGIGNNSIQKWLTSQEGTGRFDEYICYLKCGDSGSFVNTNFFHLSGTAAAIDWYVAFATVYDITDSDIYAITATDYLKTALQGSTDISGGLLATNVLLMKDSLNAIRGGMSGLSNDNIGMWAGGTYQNAIDSIAKIIMRKDGSGQLAGGKILWDLLGALSVGDFKIEGGGIIGYDSSNVEKIKLHTGILKTLTELGGSWATTPDRYGLNVTTTRFDWANTMGVPVNITNVYSSSGSFTLPNANMQVRFTGSSTTITAYNSTLYSQSETYKVYLNGSLVGTYNSSATPVTFTAAGTYSVSWQITITLVVPGNSTTSYCAINSTTKGIIEVLQSVSRTEIASNGLMSYWSTGLYLYFSLVDGLKYKGAIDIPGMLGSGSVSSGGVISRSFGKASGASGASGTVTITHNIGHSNYSVIVTSQTAARLAYISSRGNNSCVVIMTNTSGTATATAFDFALVGNNQ